MLNSIQVRNFAIIDEVEMDFRDGMTVLTGETGAGKSILVDAMGLVLGERGGTGLVRSGAKRAEFVAEFDIRNHAAAQAWLAEQMLDDEDACHLRRVIGGDGRSRAFINGNNVPLQSLKELGDLLVDIHGQHFHQSLGRRDVQRKLLDYFGGLVDLGVATRNAWNDWKSVADDLAALQEANADRGARLELLTFQLGELEALDLQPGELGELQQERSRLQNSGKLVEAVGASLQVLSDDDSANAHALLADTAQRMERLCATDPSLEPVVAMLTEAGIQVSEAVDFLRRYGDGLDLDPARRDFVEERLDAVQALSRKHRVDPDELPGLRERLARQIDDLAHAEERGQALEKAVAAAEAGYRSSASRLSAGRSKAARRLAEAVSAAMNQLGMPGGRFEISITPRDVTAPRPDGLDDIEFLLSANPGQEPMPLAKVASGGELSRMSLAIQVIASDGSDIPTMVFDEVDSGVGGGVAEMVGLKLRELGHSRQVFCVTHLPQVAAQGDHHFRVMKISDGKSTRTGIAGLTGGDRIEEIARMLGGVEITRRTREHAKEMLAAAAGRSPQRQEA